MHGRMVPMGNTVTKRSRKKGLGRNKDNAGEAEKHQKQNTTHISEFIAPMKQEQDAIRKKKEK